MRIFAFLLAVTAAAQSWKPAPVTLKTTWGEKVTPDNAWREYPRPQFVRERWQNLNGLWDYAVAPRTEPQPSKFAGKILVPFALESALSGVGQPFTPDDRLWYRRSSRAAGLGRPARPAPLRCGRLRVHALGQRRPGRRRTSGDPTHSPSTSRRSCEDGSERASWSGVTDPTDTGEQPRGKQQLDPRGIWYTPVSGIWQTVWMEPVPANVSLARAEADPRRRRRPAPGRRPGERGGRGRHLAVR